MSCEVAGRSLGFLVTAVSGVIGGEAILVFFEEEIGDNKEVEEGEFV